MLIKRKFVILLKSKGQSYPLDCHHKLPADQTNFLDIRQILPSLMETVLLWKYGLHSLGKIALLLERHKQLLKNIYLVLRETAFFPNVDKTCRFKKAFKIREQVF